MGILILYQGIIEWHFERVLLEGHFVKGILVRAFWEGHFVRGILGKGILGRAFWDEHFGRGIFFIWVKKVAS